MKNLWNNNLFWEIIGYTTLTLCIFGQITVGYIYLLAQVAYLIANTLSTIRDFALNLPRANKVKDIVFLGITISLVTIHIFK